MNREELINEFDKQELEILINDLQDIDNFTGFKNGAFKYELGKYQANLLVNCIKKQKEVIDKAIEYINSQSPDAGVSGKHIKEILKEGE